jgi:hypothetical protein
MLSKGSKQLPVWAEENAKAVSRQKKLSPVQSSTEGRSIRRHSKPYATKSVPPPRPAPAAGYIDISSGEEEDDNQQRRFSTPAIKSETSSASGGQRRSSEISGSRGVTAPGSSSPSQRPAEVETIVIASDEEEEEEDHSGISFLRHVTKVEDEDE